MTTVNPGADFDPAPAARRLAGLWRDLGQLDALPEDERPRNLAEAYVLQRRLIEEIGEPLRGYKLGLSSAAAMERTGLGAPILGYVPASRIHQSGAVIDPPASPALLLEVEVALTLPGDWVNGARAKPTARLAFEIVRSRFTRRDRIDLPSFIGDLSGFHALVLGDAIPLDQLETFLAGGASLHHDGKPVSSPASGRERPDPLDVLTRFSALVETFAMPVAPNMTIATGNLLVPFETAADGHFEGRLGAARVGFTVRRSHPAA